ncbi:MAG: hypothetical protein E7294_13900 [Lachnospiraceae bacterium]|nr:hypothetical protein [Lachnospiraceae bacterium]
MLNQLKQILLKDSITDIFLVGFVDIEDGIAEFNYDLKYLYFEIGSEYIKFESINQFSLLRFDIVNSIKFNYEVDPDMIKAKASISEIVLNNTTAIGNNIVKLLFYDFDEIRNTCAAVEMVLANGQVIFIDPSFYFGINIGGTEKKRIWEENYSGFGTVTISKIEI